MRSPRYVHVGRAAAGRSNVKPRTLGRGFLLSKSGCKEKSDGERCIAKNKKHGRRLLYTDRKICEKNFPEGTPKLRSYEDFQRGGKRKRGTVWRIANKGEKHVRKQKKERNEEKEIVGGR